MTSDKLANYVTSRGPTVTMIRRFPCRNSNKVVFRLNVKNDNLGNLVENKVFCPEYVSCMHGTKDRKNTVN